MSSPDQANTQANANLVNPPIKQTRMVKIKANTPIRVMREEKGQSVEQVHLPGSIVDVTEEEAKEFCDKKIPIGHREYFGNVDGPTAKPKTVVRAERVPNK